MRFGFLILLSILGAAICTAGAARGLDGPAFPQNWECLSQPSTCIEPTPQAESASRPAPASAPPAAVEPAKAPSGLPKPPAGLPKPPAGMAKPPAGADNIEPPARFAPSVRWTVLDSLAAALVAIAAIQAIVFFRQGGQLKKTVAASVAAANAARMSAEALQRMEAGYLYLRDPFDGNIRNPRTYAQPLQNLSTNVVFRNCGRSPVTMRRLRQAYVHVDKLDDIYAAPRKIVDLPPGIVVAAGAESQVFKCGLNFSLDELNSVAGGKGLIAYVVTVEYEDIFMRRREMGACRVWGGGAGFSVDGDKRVNFGD